MISRREANLQSPGIGCLLRFGFDIECVGSLDCCGGRTTWTPGQSWVKDIAQAASIGVAMDESSSELGRRSRGDSGD